MLASSLIGVSRTADEVFLLVFGGVVAIVATARLIGAVFVRLGQPAVVGEVVGGLLLGPSVLGLLPGDPSTLLFPPDIQPYLRILSSFGLVIYLFIVGLELDPRAMRAERRAALSISLASIAFPFALGALAASVIYASHDVATRQVDGVLVDVDVDRVAFVLFCGLAISGSAFAILARILDERRLFRTRLGGVLLASTVVDDIAVWMLASVVLAIAAAGGLAGVPLTLGGLAAFVMVLFAVVRPALRWMLRRSTDDTAIDPDIFAVILIGLLLSALFTTWLGISPILGAFFFGAAVPRDGTSRLFAQMNERLESVSVLVLLPVFFAVTGLGVDLSTIGLEGLGLLALFVVLATAGKLAGAILGASFNGIRGRRALAVGVLMNTRGLTELALLSLGLSLGVLDTTMFSVLVCTALVTTLLSGPMLRLVYPDRLIEADIAAAERERMASESDYRVLLYVDDPDHVAAPIVDVAVALTRSEPGAQLVVSHLAVAPRRSELGTGFMGDLASVTSSLDQLRELTARFVRAGIDVVPRSQQAADVATELALQVDLIRPHLVLVPAGSHHTSAVVRRLVDHGAVDVAVIQIASIGPIDQVHVGAGPEPHQTLAAEVGVRLALGLPGAMSFDSGRRLAALARVCEEFRSGLSGTDDRGDDLVGDHDRQPGSPGSAPSITVTVVPADGTVEDAGAVAADVTAERPEHVDRIVVHAHDPGTGPRSLDQLRVRLATGH